jgi:myo-inositol-1(or 4)-monophosphatase
MTAVDFAAFVDQLADASGDAIRPFFRTSLSIDDKGGTRGFDPVTAADRAAESAMRALIRRTFPGHGVVGEEFGAENPDAEFVWVLDPIDGTKSFISGMPAWGTLIALMRSGSPVYGMMHQPFIGERFYGDGSKANYRGPVGKRALRARPCASLKEAVTYTTSPLLMGEADRAAYAKVERGARLSRYGGDCYAYCMVAAGHIDLVVETDIKPYDIAALIPIVEGAGGIVTTWEGEGAQNGGRIIAAGDKRTHAEAMQVLAGKERYL